MFKIRYKTFETNSSSTHSLCICTEEEYNKWVNDEMVLDIDYERIVPMPSDEELEEENWRYIKYSDYDYKINDMETFSEEYTTKHGDKIHVFGWYGYDY